MPRPSPQASTGIASPEIWHCHTAAASRASEADGILRGECYVSVADRSSSTGCARPGKPYRSARGRQGMRYMDCRLKRAQVPPVHPPHMRGSDMHHSRLCAVLIDCKTSDVDEAARFWGDVLGRPVDLDHPSSRGNYRMLTTQPDEPIVEIQRVEHESRVDIDIETPDTPAEVRRLEKLGAKVVNRLERWVVMRAPTGQHFCVVRVQRPGFPKNASRWE